MRRRSRPWGSAANGHLQHDINMYAYRPSTFPTRTRLLFIFNAKIHTDLSSLEAEASFFVQTDNGF